MSALVEPTAVHPDEVMSAIETPDGLRKIADTIGSISSSLRVAPSLRTEGMRASELELLAILREHGVMMYFTADVERYKQAKLEQYWRLQLLARDFAIASGIVAAAGNVGALKGLVSFKSAGRLSVAAIASGLGYALVQGFTWRPRWESFSLEDFGKIPPEHQATVDRLRSAVPGLTFTVERFKVDPFLWARHDGARLCIGKWDEPEFSGPAM